jgi:hypothetical protein
LEVKGGEKACSRVLTTEQMLAQMKGRSKEQPTGTKARRMEMTKVQLRVQMKGAMLGLVYPSNREPQYTLLAVSLDSQMILPQRELAYELLCSCILYHKMRNN